MNINEMRSIVYACDKHSSNVGIKSRRAETAKALVDAWHAMPFGSLSIETSHRVRSANNRLFDLFDMRSNVDPIDYEGIKALDEAIRWATSELADAICIALERDARQPMLEVA